MLTMILASAIPRRLDRGPFAAAAAAPPTQPNSRALGATRRKGVRTHAFAAQQHRSSLLARYRRRQRRLGCSAPSVDGPGFYLQRAVTGPKRPLKISVHVEYADGDSELLDVAGRWGRCSDAASGGSPQ